MPENHKASLFDNNVKQIATNSVAAGAAVIPPYYLFVVKSALQAGLPRPSMTLDNTVIWPIKGAAIAGSVIGMQLSLTGVATRFLNKANITGVYADSISALSIAVLSVPALAADNGRTFGLTVVQSIKKLNIRQTNALVIRESTFLFGDPLGRLINDSMVRKFGDNNKTKYASTFLGGALVCFMGYPADTMLTRSQHGLDLVPLHQSFKGIGYKATAIGLFYCFYQGFKSAMSSTSQDRGRC